MADTLYVNPISPFARKAMILNRIGCLNIAEETPNRDPVHGYCSDVNPLGKIPALRREDGSIVVDSPVVCEWLDRKGPDLLASADDAIAARSLHAIGDGLATAVYDYRYEMVRDAELHWQAMIDRKTQAIRNCLRWLEDHVGRLSEGKICWGGLAVGCALDYCGFRATHVDWRGAAPKLAAWHDTTCQSEAWVSTYAYSVEV